MRSPESDYGNCEGCKQWIDPVMSQHVFDEDGAGNVLDPPLRFHVDCCPGKHVTGGCGQELIEEEE